MRTAPLALAFLLLASGCMGGGGDKAKASPTATDPNQLPPGVTNVLEGTISGPDLAPLEGVNVTVNGLDWYNITTPTGYYRFESLPPKDYVITANKEGYRPKPQRAVIQDDAIFQLDFQLEEIPLEKPRHETQDYTFQIVCQFAYQSTPEQPQWQDCAPTALPENKQVREFDVQAGAAQVQAEFFWEKTTDGSKYIFVTMEAPGENGVQFAFDKIETGGKVVISQSLMQKNYPNGGKVIVKVAAAAGMIGEESAIDVGAALQQSVECFFTTFYIEPGPPSFTVQP